MNYLVYCDGSSRGNPGPSGIGILIKDEKENVVHEIQKYIGFHTNNEAEYIAIYTALQTMRKVYGEKVEKVTIHTDSELAYNQLTGSAKIRKLSFRGFVQDILGFQKYFKIEIKRIPSVYNQWTDKLAKSASKTGRSFSNPW